MNINSRTSKINFTGFASGAIASFTGLRAAPLKVAAQIVPIQSGSGDPAPDNIRPISGWSECNVVRCGKNLWSYGTVSGTGIVVVNTNIKAGNYVFSALVTSSDTDDTKNLLLITYEDGTRTSAIIDRNVRSSVSLIFTKRVTSILFYAAQSNATSIGDTFTFADIQLELGSTATAYEAYTGNTYTIQFGDTYYGGSLDVTNGVLTVTHANIASYNGEPINEPWICSEAVYSEGTTPPIGSQVVYPLATPITVQLTPTQIEQIIGTNNIFSDSGNVEVYYVTI